MSKVRGVGILLAGLAIAPWLGAAQESPGKGLGLFTASSDIGVTQPGATTFDPSTGNYRMSGGGVDIWGTADAFSYTWRRFSGDGSLTADVAFTKPLSYPISKGVLMFRQSLAPGAAYADVAIHGDGHITLQYRATEGGETKDVTLPEHGPVRIRVERKGDVFTAYAVLADGRLGTPASITVPMHDPILVGIGVGSHNVNALQTMTFSDLKLVGGDVR
jgi:hypothetical protein